MCKLPGRVFGLRFTSRQGPILYSRFEDTMADKYRMTSQGSAFIVNENAGVTVGVYNTELEAQQRLEDCERDDLMLETARSLVEKAVEIGRASCRERV